VDNHVPSSEFNRLNHTVGQLLSRNRLRGDLGARPTVNPYRISLNKKIAEVGITHEHLQLTSESRDNPQSTRATSLQAVALGIKNAQLTHASYMYTSSEFPSCKSHRQSPQNPSLVCGGPYKHEMFGNKPGKSIVGSNPYWEQRTIGFYISIKHGQWHYKLAMVHQLYRMVLSDSQLSI
jgi:hypothetical protein